MATLEQKVCTLVAALGLVLAHGCSGPRDAGPPDAGPPFVRPSSLTSVLFVGAHPDDEGYGAPLLAEWCALPGVACHFLVITDGGKGNCMLGAGACGTSDTGGAPPGSVGAFRLAELQKSVEYFHGTFTALALDDTASATAVGDMENWNQSYSGVANDTSVTLIVGKVAQVIRDTHPDVIVTFDPRHGVYCQPDHRAAAGLAILAAQREGFDLRRLLMLEMTEFYRDSAGHVVRRAWVTADPAVSIYDAADAGTWAAYPAVLGIYRSQFTQQSVNTVANVAPVVQTVPVAWLADELDGGKFQPSAYDDICASQAWWDGKGVCPRANGTVGPCW